MHDADGGPAEYTARATAEGKPARSHTIEDGECSWDTYDPFTRSSSLVSDIQGVRRLATVGRESINPRVVCVTCAELISCYDGAVHIDGKIHVLPE